MKSARIAVLAVMLLTAGVLLVLALSDNGSPAHLALAGGVLASSVALTTTSGCGGGCCFKRRSKRTDDELDAPTAYQQDTA
ncbi:MAG: hypothetical protein AAFX05_06415 [Planctomycetota bacterium]